MVQTGSADPTSYNNHVPGSFRSVSDTLILITAYTHHVFSASDMTKVYLVALSRIPISWVPLEIRRQGS
jgi:hypothetical protein